MSPPFSNCLRLHSNHPETSPTCLELSRITSKRRKTPQNVLFCRKSAPITYKSLFLAVDRHNLARNCSQLSCLVTNSTQTRLQIPLTRSSRSLSLTILTNCPKINANPPQLVTTHHKSPQIASILSKYASTHSRTSVSLRFPSAANDANSVYDSAIIPRSSPHECNH